MKKRCLLTWILIQAGLLMAQTRTVIVVELSGAATDSLKTNLFLNGKDMAEIKKTRPAPGQFKFVFNLVQAVQANLITFPGEIKEPLTPASSMFEVFIEPGDSLHLVYNVQQPAHTVQFSGKGAFNNQFEAKYNEVRKAASKEFAYTLTDSPNQCMEKSQKKFDYLQQWLKTAGQGLNATLLRNYETAIYLSRLLALFNLPYTLREKTGGKLSAYIPTGYWELDQLMKENITWRQVPGYFQLLSDVYPRFLLLKKYKAQHKIDETVNPMAIPGNYYLLVHETYRNPKIRSEINRIILGNIILANSTAFKGFEHLGDHYFTNYAKYDNNAAELKENYNAYIQTQKGNLLPNISVNGLDGQAFSLQKFKGKVLYIDIWASWCPPCRNMIRTGGKTLHQQLEKEKDIVFAYISIDDDLEKWKKAIKDDQSEGLHLVSRGGYNSSAAKAFFLSVTGLPRYVIVDKAGKIYSAMAARPDDPGMANLLLQLAKAP